MTRILQPVTAFSGLRVLDFAEGLAGAMASMLLADFGADVVRVEPAGHSSEEADPGFHTWNRNKRRIRFDLADYEGRARALDLLARADVAVFDSRPGELERLGLDSETLTSRHPALVHVWLPPYGSRGRWSQLPPDHLLLSALAGVAWQQGSFEDVPVCLVTPQISYGHAVVAANAIGAALYRRAKDGRGQAVTVSGLHGVAAVESGGHVQAEGILRLTGRSSRGGVAHYRLYQCADGLWFFLGCLTPAFFLRALETVGLLDLLLMDGVEGEFMNLLQPGPREKAIAALDARFLERPRDEWMKILKECGVPCGPVGDRDSWFDGETVAANGMKVELEHDTLGPIAMPGVSARLSATPGAVRHLVADIEPEEIVWKPREVPESGGAETKTDPVAAKGSGGPLTGVRVLDLGVVIAGPFGPCVLANLGADVIKVEPLDGDISRPYGLGFVGYNQGKRGIAIDLKQPEGRQALLELAREADVIVDNFRPGVRERLGIDYEALRRMNPQIVSCSVTGYGREGPLSEDPGFDPILQALGGLMAAQGGDGEPVFHQIPVNDTGSGLMSAFGVLAALVARERTGEGQEVSTSLANQTIVFQSGELTRYKGRPERTAGGRDFPGPTALRRFYSCCDGSIAVAATAPEHFQSLAVALGHPEWTARFIAEWALAEPPDGLLATAIAETLKSMPRDEAVERLLAREVPAAPAMRPAELFEDPWALANGHIWHFEHPQFGSMSAVRGFAEFSRTPGGWRRRAPLLGEHTVEVLGEWGLGAARARELGAGGVMSQL